MLDEPQDDEQPRRRGFFRGEDPDANPLVILASYAATVILAGLVVGAACAALPYYLAASASGGSHTARSQEYVLNHDSGAFAKWRFWGGAAAGAGATLVGLVAFNMRKRN